jgi:two-component system invasion response regulator UvrY
MTRILIADDHPMLRTGLRELLTEEIPGIEIGEASSGAEALARLRDGHWDLLLLDLDMPGRNGLDILRYVSASHTGTRVLVLSGFAERLYAVSVLRAGARGYVPKEYAPTELMAAIQCVLGGRRYISPMVAELLASSSLDSDSQQLPHGCLSEREFQVFYKLAGGRGVTDIGAELCLSAKTISTYRSRILEKMNFVCNAEITTYALENALI